jgi:hypothetical protein
MSSPITPCTPTLLDERLVLRVIRQRKRQKPDREYGSISEPKLKQHLGVVRGNIRWIAPPTRGAKGTASHQLLHGLLISLYDGVSHHMFVNRINKPVIRKFWVERSIKRRISFPRAASY